MKSKTENKEKQAKKETINPVVTLSTRGRTFEGTVTKRFDKRVVLEFERTVFVKKYERFYKKKTRIHARLPENMDIKVGDYIKVRECRPLSKIIHFMVIDKIRSAEKAKEVLE